MGGGETALEMQVDQAHKEQLKQASDYNHPYTGEPALQTQIKQYVRYTGRHTDTGNNTFQILMQ